MTRVVRLLLAIVLLTTAPALAEDGWILREPAALEWKPAASLPPGAMVAVLEGDPAADGFFTMRIKMPDGYRVPAHWHSRAERVTVLSGVLHLGHGDVFDPAGTKALTAGTYSAMPAGMRHFGAMEGETVLQLSTMGPWTITYVNPDDDPRRQR